jgi:uncharacterized protein
MRCLVVVGSVLALASCRELTKAPASDGAPPRVVSAPGSADASSFPQGPESVSKARLPGVVWRTLDSLWYRDEPGKPRAYGVTPVSAGVTANPSTEVRVGVLEEYAGATGTQWRTSMWLASFLAAQTLGLKMTDYQFAISVGGFIDGPSAGALMAVGFMAALLRDSVRPDASMTGAVAPDGSVMPVSGIPEKLQAAKAAGKKVVGIPAGQAISAGEDGKKVDAIALGQRLGIEVREVRDLREAYALLTGNTLPLRPPVPVERMKIPQGMALALGQQAKVLVERTQRDALLVARDQTTGVKRLLAKAAQMSKMALDYLAHQDQAAAFLRAVSAASLAKAAVRVVSLGGSRKLEAEAGSPEASEEQVAALEKAIADAAASGALKPLALLSAASAAAQARGFLEVAGSLLGTVIQKMRVRKFGAGALLALKKSGQAILPAIYLGFADLAAERGKKALEAPGELATPLRFNLKALGRGARSFVSAASGNVQYIDALLLKDVATQQKRSIEDIRAAFGQNERSYLLAAQLANLALSKTLEDKGSVGSSLLRLASAADSYVDSALVITKYYSLESAVSENDPASQVAVEAGLAALLERAEVGAREAAAIALSRLGIVPPEAQFHYRAAQEFSRGNTREKLRALGEYWRSTVASRIAAMVLSK